MAKGTMMQAIVEIAGKLSPTLQSSIKNAQKSLDGLNLKAIAVGAAAAAGVVAIGKAVFEAGEYLADLGSQFDQATDAIRIGTGAVGEDLDALVDSFETVYSSVPASMDDASKAISDYNTRLGLTGKELENLSVQALQVSDMLGDDLGGVIESSSKAFTNWSLSADKYGSAMDYVFKVSQSTGAGFSSLMGSMEQYGAQLQAVGYDFNSAVALLGQLDKAGIDAGTVMNGLRNAANVASKAGFDSVSEGIETYIERVKNAESETRALEMASAMFGSKTAPTMVKAIKDGTLSLEALQSALDASGESINKAAADTYDYSEMMTIIGNKAKVALKPLADSVFQMLNDLMPVISDLMTSLNPVIEDLTSKLVPIIQDVVPTIMPMVQDLIPVISDIAGVLAGDVLPPIIEMIKDLLPTVLTIVKALTPILSTLAKTVLPLITSIVSALSPIINAVIQNVLPVLTMPFELIAKAADFLKDAWKGIVDFFAGIWEGIKKIFTSGGNVFEGLKDGILDVFTTIVNGLIKGINAVIAVPFKGINWALEKIKGINILGLKPFDWISLINVPEIPLLAKGGFTDGIAIAGEAGREAVISFDEAYRDRNIDIWYKTGELLGTLPDMSVVMPSADAISGDLSYEGQAARLLDLEGFSLAEQAGTGGNTYITYDFSGFTWAPNVDASGSDSDEFMTKLREHEAEFFDWLGEFTRMKAEARYA